MWMEANDCPLQVLVTEAEFSKKVVGFLLVSSLSNIVNISDKII